MMNEDETISVSKGVFVFKNNFKRAKVLSRKDSKNANNIFSKNLWYQEYISLWTSIKEDIDNLTSSIFSSMATDLLHYIRTSYHNGVSEIPTIALLTGINIPDHDSQFKNLEKQIKGDISPHVATLSSQTCSTLKNLMENMIHQFINDYEQASFNEDELETTEFKGLIKKSQLNLPLLERWYEDLYPSEASEDEDKVFQNNRKLLIVIFPDFESFDIKILQKLILIVNSYLKKLPFVFIFGIATSLSTLHTAFPYHVSSKISIKMFKCQPSVILLNKLLENVFLNSFCPFHLGGKVFNLITDIFLFYDFSVRNFIQNIKYSMMEHFSYGNAMSLCNLDKREVKEILDLFVHDDFENVRHLMSFRKLVGSETYQNQINLLTDDKYFKNILFNNIILIQKYIRRLHIFLKCLHMLVEDLPGFPLGKQLRELYAIAVSENITQTPQYKECFQLLNFQSKDELSAKLVKIMNLLSQMINENSKRTQLKDFYSTIKTYQDILNNFDNISVDIEDEGKEGDNKLLDIQMDRKSLREALLSKSIETSKPLNKYEKSRREILDFFSKSFEIYLPNPSSFYFYEIFFFDDIQLQNKIVGIHRSAIHTALNDPWYYFQCNCCEIANQHSMKPTMPDICIAYKLHLECGKMINMYDWLQAFSCIIDPVDDSNDKFKRVDPEIQARFTQAVAELEYLGFIKSSKRKVDHVCRLTWGG